MCRILRSYTVSRVRRSEHRNLECDCIVVFLRALRGDVMELKNSEKLLNIFTEMNVLAWIKTFGITEIYIPLQLEVARIFSSIEDLLKANTN